MRIKIKPFVPIGEVAARIVREIIKRHIADADPSEQVEPAKVIPLKRSKQFCIFCSMAYSHAPNCPYKNDGPATKE